MATKDYINGGSDCLPQNTAV